MSPPEAVGLTQPEVTERQQQGQVNLVEKFTTRTVPGILRNNIVTVFNGILTASVVALLAVGANSDAVFLSIVTLANMLVGGVSEFRAKWALDRLALLQHHVVTVSRDGHDQEISSDEVVKDDLVHLMPGDQVVADGMLAPSAPVVMDESLLTGEAVAVEKRAGDTVLSGGQQQRLCIARAIAVKPEVLLLDEPTSALDPISTAHIERLVDELKKEFTIVIVTHNMQQAARISDFTAYMYLGELIEFGDTSAVFTNPKRKETEDYITGRFG